jgi:hypothetical protein
VRAKVPTLVLAVVALSACTRVVVLPAETTTTYAVTTTQATSTTTMPQATTSSTEPPLTADQWVAMVRFYSSQLPGPTWVDVSSDGDLTDLYDVLCSLTQEGASRDLMQAVLFDTWVSDPNMSALQLDIAQYAVDRHT